MTAPILTFPPPVEQPANTYPIVPLETPVEFERYCYLDDEGHGCDATTTFKATEECRFGLLGRCSKCGGRRIAPYTRTNGRRE